MTPEVIIAIASGTGTTVPVLLIWIRQVIKERDFWRDLALQGHTMTKAAVTELESRPNPPRGRLAPVRDT